MNLFEAFFAKIPYFAPDYSLNYIYKGEQKSFCWEVRVGLCGKILAQGKSNTQEEAYQAREEAMESLPNCKEFLRDVCGACPHGKEDKWEGIMKEAIEKE